MTASITVVLLAAAAGAVLQVALGCPAPCEMDEEFLLVCNCSDKGLSTIPVTNVSEVMIRLRHNQLTSLESKVFYLAGYELIDTIDVMYNRISTVAPDAFYGLVQLARIDLGHNNIITVTKDTFGNLPRLSSINLSNNPLTAITGTSSSAPRHFEFLSLADCNISSLEDVFRPPSDNDVSWLDFLTRVRIYGNNISCISDEMVTMINKTNVFMLHSNPLRSECVSSKFDELNTVTYVNITSLRQNAGA